MRVFFAAIVCFSQLSLADWSDKLFSEKAHDFGTVAKGQKAEHLFVLKNPYKQAIELGTVTASCGCTTPKIEGPTTIAPGETSGIRAIFNSDRFTGKRTATITVRFVGQYRGEAQLQVQGYIRNDLELTPSELVLGEVYEGETKRAEIDLSHYRNKKWKILSAKFAEAPEVDIRVIEVNGGGVKSYRLSAETSGAVEIGRYDGFIRLETNDETQKVVQIPVRFSVRAAVEMRPPTQQVGAVSGGEALKLNFILTSKEAIEVLSVESSSSELKESFTAQKSARAHVIRLEGPAPRTPGPFSGTVTVRTSSKSKPVIEASWEGSVRDRP